MLRRLAYPNTRCDLVDIFGRAEPELSIAFNMVTLRHVSGHVFMSHKLISLPLLCIKVLYMHVCIFTRIPDKLLTLTVFFIQNITLLQIVDEIYTRFNHLLSSSDLTWLDPAHFAQAIHQKGAPLDQCWGFIDGTAQQIARPLRNQQIMFSGHKRIQRIKFQV